MKYTGSLVVLGAVGMLGVLQVSTPPLQRLIAAIANAPHAPHPAYMTYSDTLIVLRGGQIAPTTEIQLQNAVLAHAFGASAGAQKLMAHLVHP